MLAAGRLSPFPRVIDIDTPITWPLSLRIVAARAAIAMREHAGRPTCDLSLPSSVAQDINAELEDIAIRGYHCTRLLDHEVAALRAEGLRAASDTLMADKLNAAVDVGAITQTQADQLQTDSPLHKQRRNRQWLVCACTTRRTLDGNADGLQLLLTHWGGEIIYFWQRDPVLLAHLQSLGKPSIVVVDLLPGRADDLWTPAPATLIAGRVLGSERVCGAVHYAIEPETSIPVVDIWQPGDPEYDRHRELPAR